MSLLTDLATEMVGSSLPLYLTTWLRVGPIALASVDAAQQAMTALMRIGTSLVADRTRRHRLMAAGGYATSALARLLLVFGLPSAATVGGSVVVDRFGKGIRTGPRDALISAGTPPERLGAAFGVHRALDAVGAFAGPLVTFMILRRTHGTGFRAVFGVAAVIGVVGVAALVLLVPVPAVVARVRAPTRARRPTQLMLVAGLVGACTVGDALVLIVLLRGASLAGSTYPLMAVAASLVFAVLAGPFGALADCVPPMYVYLAGSALLGVTYVLLGNGLPATTVPVFAVLAAMGVAAAASDGVLAALVARDAHRVSSATAQASVQTATSIGRAVGSSVFGFLWAAVGAPTAFAAFGVAMLAVCLATTAHTVRTPRTPHMTRTAPEDVPTAAIR